MKHTSMRVMDPRFRAMVYREAARVIQQGWTRGQLARDAMGGQVDPTVPGGTQFCLIGAVLQVFSRVGERPETSLFAEGGIVHEELSAGIEYIAPSVRHYHLMSPMAWNDHLAKSGEEVALALRVTADLLEGKKPEVESYHERQQARVDQYAKELMAKCAKVYHVATPQPWDYKDIAEEKVQVKEVTIQNDLTKKEFQKMFGKELTPA